MPEPKIEWRPVVGYEGFYDVSEFGDVRRLAGTPTCKQTRLLTPRITGRPTPRVTVTVSKDGLRQDFQVHKLVAYAFLGVLPLATGGEHAIQIDHVDGNWVNNHYTNLEYVSLKENHARATAMGLKAHGAGHGNAKITDDAARAIREMEGPPQWMIGEIFGVSQMTVSLIKQKKAWKHVI